jgi:nitrate reductase molybdenum cofactor assembly chaperone
MTTSKQTHNDLSITLRVLARLLQYPDADNRGHLQEMRAALHGARAIGRQRLAELDALIDSQLAQSPIDAEADYVQLFDCGRATSLHLFEHVHGDSRDRGPAMIDLAKTYEAAGLFLAEGELPDYLPVVLEFASTQPPVAGARLPVGSGAHPQRHLQRAAKARELLRQRAGRAARDGGRDGPRRAITARRAAGHGLGRARRV